METVRSRESVLATMPARGCRFGGRPGVNWSDPKVAPGQKPRSDVVGEGRFELPASCSQSRRAAKLRHSPDRASVAVTGLGGIRRGGGAALHPDGTGPVTMRLHSSSPKPAEPLRKGA